MKHKLLVTLIASALELYATSSTAQAVGQCDLVGNATIANGSTPVLSSRLNPVNGFPEYVTDTNGLSLKRCLDPAICFFDPIVTTDPFSLQIGSGGEAFYWAADAILSNQAGTPMLKLVMAAETAFLQGGPNGEPINGSQLPFLRLRLVFDAPADGTYILRHPYGSQKLEVVGATGNRDIFFTADVGLTALQSTQGQVGPFLTWPDYLTTAPAGYVGDVNVLNNVVGSPCGFNQVELTGVDSAGNPIDFGGGQTILVTDLFAVQGAIQDTAVVQTSLVPSRLTYSRSALADGQIEAFAVSQPTATVTVQDGPTIPAGSSRIATAVTLDSTVFSTALDNSVNSTNVAVADASALPPVVKMTATSATTVPTALNVRLIDFVDITQADYDPASGILSVAASSGDKRVAPALTLRGFGDFAAGTGLKNVTTVAPPAEVQVDSSAGGTAKAQVRVIVAVAPAAPTALTSTAATSTTVNLSWTDNSDNETGFQIFSVAANGTRTSLGTVGAGATSFVATGLTAATAYTFQVDAVNNVGGTASESFTTSTPALPLAPATASFILSTSAQRTLLVSWADTATDETAYRIYRRTGTAAFTLISTQPAGTTSYTDATGTGNTAYTYQVVAVRGPDSSAPTTSNSITTPATPTSAAIGTATVSGNSVTLNWGDRSSNETGFQVYRRLGTGAFAAVSGILPSTVGGSTTTPVGRNYLDTPVANGTYNYRVDVSNWAGTVQSANSAAVTVLVASLAAPSNVTAIDNGRPTVSWTDNSTGESGYRLIRRTQTVNNQTGLMTEGAATTRNLAANLQTFREPTALANNLTLRYEVLAVNGTTLGASTSVYALTTALPTAPRPAAAANGAGNIRLTWAALTTASVGGYEIQRCEGVACTNFSKVTGTAVNTAGTVDGRATVAFNNTGLTSGTSYTYRMRTVGGSGTGKFGATFGATRTLVAP